MNLLRVSLREFGVERFVTPMGVTLNARKIIFPWKTLTCLTSFVAHTVEYGLRGFLPVLKE
jgi:hypothetical protein